ncbi:MAG TPA: alanine--tRNA ligase [Gemmatimonadaceae bacterium]|nr:alanine--tRNA ligase [Gemmatimonadaceae bacterium]
MKSSDIREAFLKFFEGKSHLRRPSASLAPEDDPTLLFVNAGMVPFKRVFLGLENPPEGKRRATSAQRCVRAGGKHNDLEQVGHTARHHTFFEMLGNFSFGDYFKRDAISFAWEFVTGTLALDPAHLRVSVFREDDEARMLWREIAGLPDSRIYGLDEADNFWQMADTGPCGPCTEIYVDLAHVSKDWRFPEGAQSEWAELNRTEFSRAAFVEGAEAGRFLEIWNLVFMQFDRQLDGTLVPLPKPSVDTGAGLERITAVKQGVTNNYHTDLFRPLIDEVSRVTGIPYPPFAAGANIGRATDARFEHGGRSVDPASFRVLADHARAVAFLLSDGVFPSNEGRGYVLRRILRRGVRHAWLLGRREPTLVHVVERLIADFAAVHPELRTRREHIVETTRAEEERFLATIDAGMGKFDEIAPPTTTQGSAQIRGTISGDDAFVLYDRYGFPIDLTELMAQERGYTVDIAGFEEALGHQRRRSQTERKSRMISVSMDALDDREGWDSAPGETPSARFVGYDAVEIETQVTAVKRLDGNRVAVLLRESPFYAESGGQISDRGEIVGAGWRVDVDDVRKIDGRPAALGGLHGTLAFGTVTARVPTDRRRDTERNHTATHLLHAALRKRLGEHVHQAGSLVAPDRLRFDFTHHGPVKPDVLVALEADINRDIWQNAPVRTTERPYKEAVASGAMALFGEKYGDVVRVVEIPGISMELCGGTHVRSTGEIALFKIVHETGVAAGVRRIEAVTGPGAYDHVRDEERTLARVTELLKTNSDALVKRVEGLLDELKTTERRLAEAQRGGSQNALSDVMNRARSVNGARIVSGMVAAPDVKTLQALGDTVREGLGSGVAFLGAAHEDGKATLLVVVTDDLRQKGVSANDLVKAVGAKTGARGGGKPHMAQAGFASKDALESALPVAAEIGETAVSGAA